MTSPGRMTMMEIAALLLSGWAPSHASMLRLIEQVCPIDGETFAASEVMSGTTRGRYLDLA